MSDIDKLWTRMRATGCIALLLSAGCGAGGQEPDDQMRGDAVTPAVEVVQARLDALPLTERFTGTVQASGQVEIYPQTDGRIIEVLAENGDIVSLGQPLVRIESVAPRSQLAQTRAALAVAQAEARATRASLTELEARLRRTELLAADSLVSQEELETQRAQVEAARAVAAQAEAGVTAGEAALDQSQDALGRSTIRAPIAGVVGRRNAEVGMVADGSTALFTIGTLDRMRVRLPVSQDLIGRIRAGQRAEIRTDAEPVATISAEVSRISPFLAEGSFSAEAQIDVAEPAGRLVPGMFVTVDVFHGESDSTTVVPTSALYDNPDIGGTGVFVAEPPGPSDAMSITGEGGTGTLTDPMPVRFVPVVIVAEGRQSVGIAGVRPDQWVVVVGQHLLARGGEDLHARLRASSWQRIIRLQERQGPELLREVMEEHRTRIVPDEVPGSPATPDRGET